MTTVVSSRMSHTEPFAWPLQDGLELNVTRGEGHGALGQPGRIADAGSGHVDGVVP